MKIRGFRIEPGEIESTLLQHEQVHEAAVVATHPNLPDNGSVCSDKYLVAYVVCSRPRPTSDQLHRFLQPKLIEAMIPSAFVCLDSLPRTPNGKIDRRALPAIDEDTGTQPYVVPRTTTEERIAEIWAANVAVVSWRSKWLGNSRPRETVSACWCS